MTGERGIWFSSLCKGIGSLGLLAVGPVLLGGSPASAATSAAAAGTATIATPGGTARTPLSSGGARTPFTVVLPANAGCPGDTAHFGYHVYSYLVPAGTNLASVTFVNFPSKGYGLVNSYGKYYGAINTAQGTGQIVGIPDDFEWGPLVTSGGGRVPVASLVAGASHGVWEAGIACANTHGALAARWNTQVTFSASSQGANALSWRATPGMASVTTGIHAGRSQTHPSQHSQTAATAENPAGRHTSSGASVHRASVHATGAHVAGMRGAGVNDAGANVTGVKDADGHGQAGATQPREVGTTGGATEQTGTGAAAATSEVAGFPLPATVVGALALAACVALGLRRRWRSDTVSTTQRSAS